MMAANNCPLSSYLFGMEQRDAECWNGLMTSEETGTKHEGNRKEGVKNNQHGDGNQGRVEERLERRGRLDS